MGEGQRSPPPIPPKVGVHKYGVRVNFPTGKLTLTPLSKAGQFAAGVVAYPSRGLLFPLAQAFRHSKCRLT